MTKGENHILNDRLVPVSISHPNFSDIVQGEDLEFRNSIEPTPFKINPPHIEPTRLSHYYPSSILSRMSSSQLTTMAGAASGFLAGVVVCPLDVCKTRLQAQGAMVGQINKYNGFLHTVKTILREEGIRGLYRGLVPITIGYLPTWTIYFTVYEQGKKRYPKILHKQGIESDALTHFCSALTAGMVSTIGVNPIWVVKTRLMIQTGSHSSIYDGSGAAKNQTYYRGTLDAFRQMYKEEGIKVFYSGLVPSMFGLLHVGIHFPVYEKLKIMLRCNNISEQEKEVSGILWRLIAASCISKMIASSITYPHEILRTRMQLKKINSESHVLLKAIAEIYHCDGFKGFYAGYGTNLARTVPASAVTLVSFEYFKTYLLALSGKLETLE